MNIYILQKFKQDSEDAIEWPHLQIHSFTCNIFYLGAQGQLMPLFKGDTYDQICIILSPVNIIHCHGNRSSVLIWLFLMHLNCRTVFV